MDFPPLPRRRFLQAAVTGAAFVAVALPGLPARAAPAAPDRHATASGILLVLDARRAEILSAFAEATLVSGNGFPSVADAGVVARIDEELFFTDAAIRDDFLLAIDAIDLLPIAWGQFSRLRRMTAEHRRQFLDGLADTRFETVRALVNGLRMVTGLVYYAHPATGRALGCEGPHAGLPPQDREQRAYYRQATGRDDSGSPRSPGENNSNDRGAAA